MGANVHRTIGDTMHSDSSKEPENAALGANVHRTKATPGIAIAQTQTKAQSSKG
jgi:hypothetical protein